MPCRLIAIKLIEDETTGVASKLNIIKICSRRQSKLIVPQLHWGTPSNPYKKQNVLG